MVLLSSIENPVLIWFAIGFVFIMLEFLIPGVFVLFFGLGAWLVALICLFYIPALNAQLIIFLISSIVLLIVLRRSLKHLFNPGAESADFQTLEDEFTGHTATVSQDIQPPHSGKVEFKGTEWEAESDVPVIKGTQVRILSRESIRLKVTPN